MVPRHRRFIVSADRIVLMTDMTLAGIRDTQRIMAAIANLGTAAPVHVIAGRIGDGEAQISRAQFERGTKAKLEALIPHDTKTVKLAANRGKSIFAVGGGTSALAKSVRSLAGFIVPAGVPTAGAAAAAEGGFLGKLFGGKG
jgi:pilus assembly protein CpaE